LLIVAARGPSGKHNRLENMSHIDAGMIQLHCRIAICYQANEYDIFRLVDVKKQDFTRCHCVLKRERITAPVG